jgi:hypothetical protein
MAAHSSQLRSNDRRHGRGRHRARPQRHLEPYNWLGAGAITVTVALGAAFVGGSGIARADEDSGKPAATASSSESASTSSGAEVHTPKPASTPGTDLKKTEPDTPASGGSATTEGATTPKVADTQPDSTKAVDAASSDPTSSSEKSSETEATTPSEHNGEKSQTEATSAPEKADVVAGDPQAVVEAGEVSNPDPVATVETPSPFAYSASRSSSTARQTATVALAAPAALPNPLGLIGAVIAYDLKGAQHLMNPVIAGALGVWHLQTGINELKTLHLIGGALDIISGVLALATPILKALPVPGATLLIPVTAVLGSTTATINTIGQGLLHW